MTAIAPIMQAFFTDRLMSQLHASPHTIASYRDTMRLLLAFARQQHGKESSELDFTDLDAPTVGAFLTHLETTRGNGVTTRNARLVAVHSLFRYASLHVPEHAELISRVLAIPDKRHDHPTVCYLTRAEISALLAAPDTSTTCTRVPGMRFPDPRVQALLGACCALALRPAGFTSRDLRHYLAPQLGKTPEDMTGGQISYDLRGLRAHQIIERIPHSRAYQVTKDGLTIALWSAPADPAAPDTRPRLAHQPRTTRPQPTPASRPRLLRRPDRSRPAGIPRRLTPAAITRSNHEPVISRHTRRNLTRNSKSLRGKITYGRMVRALYLRTSRGSLGAPSTLYCSIVPINIWWYDSSRNCCGSTSGRCVASTSVTLSPSDGVSWSCPVKSPPGMARDLMVPASSWTMRTLTALSSHLAPTTLQARG